MTSESSPSFAQLGLPPAICETLTKMGYEQPSAIQARSIGPLLEGNDLLGIAQTGTGKTAAFALPLMARLTLQEKKPAVLVLTPTRELCIQVAEAFETYADGIKGLNVLAVYGGQEMGTQLRQLRRNPQVIVGTPGRVMDHIRRGTLDLSELQSVVLDEADEMLRMGFIEDVEWILEHTPKERQLALFSATMPPVIKRICDKFLNKPVEVRIESATRTVDKIEQSYVEVNGARKIKALDLLLETDEFDAVIVFVRTKNATQELAQQLEMEGYRAAAIHGDLNQRQRELCIRQLKDGIIDIMVATDVAARGIDVSRITHVVNYDVPYDGESYIHRIGRTGRAGRSGKAILFVTNRERRMLRIIEKTTGQPVKPMQLPTAETLRKTRFARFADQIKETLEKKPLDSLREALTEVKNLHGISDEELALALAFNAQKSRPLVVSEQDVSIIPKRKPRDKENRDRDDRPSRDRGDRPSRDRGERNDRGGERGERKTQAERSRDQENLDMDTYRIMVGRKHSVRVGDILGAIANELGIESKYIGNIKLEEDNSTIQLPEGMPSEVFTDFKKIRVRNYPIHPELIKPGDHSARNYSNKKPGGPPKSGGKGRPGNPKSGGGHRPPSRDK